MRRRATAPRPATLGADRRGEGNSDADHTAEYADPGSTVPSLAFQRQQLFARAMQVDAGTPPAIGEYVRYVG